jgi:hypothetical protein
MIYQEIAHILPLFCLLFNKYWNRICLLSKYFSPPHDVGAPTRKHDIRRPRIGVFAKATAHNFPVNMWQIILDATTNLFMNFLASITGTNLKYIAMPPFI